MSGCGMAAADAKSNEFSKSAEIVCMADSFGDQAKGQTAMDNCLQKSPDINVVHTINQPAAAGAFQALKAAGKERGVVIVWVDGGGARCCRCMRTSHPIATCSCSSGLEGLTAHLADKQPKYSRVGRLNQQPLSNFRSEHDHGFPNLQSLCRHCPGAVHLGPPRSDHHRLRADPASR